MEEWKKKGERLKDEHCKLMWCIEKERVLIGDKVYWPVNDMVAKVDSPWYGFLDHKQYDGKNKRGERDRRAKERNRIKNNGEKEKNRGYLYI